MILSPEEMGALIRVISEPSADLPPKRALCVILRAEGFTFQFIAQYTGLNTGQVHSWVKRYETMGVDGLRTKRKRGRPGFDESVRQRVRQLVSTPPQQLGLAYKRWTLDRLRDTLIEEKLVPSISNASISGMLGGVRRAKIN